LLPSHHSLSSLASLLTISTLSPLAGLAFSSHTYPCPPRTHSRARSRTRACAHSYPHSHALTHPPTHPPTYLHTCCVLQEVVIRAFDRESVFQVGYCDEANVLHPLYIQAGDDRTRSDWMAHLRYLVGLTTKLKSPKYHTSAYQDKAWLCCQVSTHPLTSEVSGGARARALVRACAGVRALSHACTRVYMCSFRVLLSGHFSLTLPRFVHHFGNGFRAPSPYCHVSCLRPAPTPTHPPTHPPPTPTYTHLHPHTHLHPTFEPTHSPTHTHLLTGEVKDECRLREELLCAAGRGASRDPAADRCGR
jgi:hypothetical protein